MDTTKTAPEMAERPNSQPGSLHANESPDSATDRASIDDGDNSSLDVQSPLTDLSNEHPANEFKPDVVSEKETLRSRDTESLRFEGDDEDPAVPRSFQRSSSPTVMQRSKGTAYGKVGEEGVHKMRKFSLYETSTRFYLVGGDIMDKHYRVLKIDRTSPPGHLNIFEDDIVYDKREMNQLLNAIDDGNKGQGGMKLKCSAWGLLGFVRFTEAYYMLLITKKAQAAMIGGHYVYQVEGTELIPLTTGSTSRFQKDRNPEEARYLSILNNLDLTKGFYFSYSYNITQCLQHNIIQARKLASEGLISSGDDVNDMFVWNQYLLEPARTALKNPYDWCRPVIHGYIDQSSMDVVGRRVYLTIIARRSRFFAGARFLKRGANDLGYVANDVETEQIVSELVNTSFHAPGPRLYASPMYTSYVQHRGSIPLYWTQDNTGVAPKPDIDLNLIDPFYAAAALHFDNLFERYGAPVYVLNLIKARERTPRESKLLHEYQNAIDYLNQALPPDKKILYEAFDMARASKTRGHDVISTLESLSEKVLQKTGFFHNGDAHFDEPQVQNGVARTNCIDCLDRTNACQFVIGKRALGRQLQALGIIEGNTVEYDTDCVNMFTHMFHGHGDAIAIQYGGSQLVNTMATYRKLNHWQNSSRDMVESFKRYYHNSFLDSQRQEAYNLFLGNFIFTHGQPMLWELPTDYYLHHEDPRLWLSKGRRSYINWYTPSFLEPRTLPSVPPKRLRVPPEGVSEHDDYWAEYYRPLALSSFLKIFAFRLSSSSRTPSDRSTPTRAQDVSPFTVRRPQNEHESPNKHDKKHPKKGVTIVDPSSETDISRDSLLSRRQNEKHLTVPGSGTLSPVKTSILREPQPMTEFGLASTNALPPLTNSTSTTSTAQQKPFTPADKSQMTQWTITQFYENSLNPSVTMEEEAEYAKYIKHPLNLPLVTSTDIPLADGETRKFIEYISMGSAPEYHDAASMRPMTAETMSLQPPLSAYATSEFDQQSLPPTRPASSLSIFRPITPTFSHSVDHEPSIMGIDMSGSGNNIVNKFQVSQEDIEEYEEFLKVKDNPLDVLEDDGDKKRYKAYRQWLKGRSFFKQSKVDPEWQNHMKAGSGV